MRSEGWNETIWGEIVTLEYGKSLRDYANYDGKVPVIMPDNITLSAFQKTIKPIFENILETEKQSAALNTICDALLPKLMSGEIEV